ncbi:MAG TPA: type II toxin-antitoxin system VapC family toxin [Methanocella sp.]|uniref:type II toxin-antitoxin system VapC family toxin n=1 Tax=Methanocella sp. TaxID=2052833 RepID=UPI002BB955A0|nr:type II toxin-antitoxin system VapC family toxin [Methanocella sp.]HTY92190.1 type II toxin-antitoxin system VapC family toxin [Methanocella sp.]
MVEQVDGLVYYTNGTISYGMATGTITVSNPASTSPLSSAILTLPNGTSLSIGSISPGSSYTAHYVLSPADVNLPLNFKENVVPVTLTNGVPQQLRLIVQLQNTGNAHITGLQYQKSLPPGLAQAWEAHDGGSLTVGSAVAWTINDLAPGDKMNLTIAFSLTPSSGITFPAAGVSYDYSSSLSGSVPRLTASTNTSFQIQKSHITDHSWMVNATVPDSSEFDMVLDSVAISRSNASDPFNTVELASYSPNTRLNPGSSWSTSLIDNFEYVPAYFMKMAYSMPYTTILTSHVEAMTAPITITITNPTPTPTSPPSPPYATPTPVPSATPTPTAPASPDIVFVSPERGEVITGNSTQLETSVPPSGEPGYVAYFLSSNNLTWIRLGQSPVSGALSGFLWTIPQLDGNYYLKAEHYRSDGTLLGIAYTQVLVAHETEPVGMTTMLISGTDWLMLIMALLAVMLLAFILIPYVQVRNVIYDASALAALSREKDWLSKLPREALRPDAMIVEIPGMDKIRMKALNNIDEMRRLERKYELSAYDAMALQLARESGATLVTGDVRMAAIAKQLDVKVKLLEKVAVPVTV